MGGCCTGRGGIRITFASPVELRIPLGTPGPPGPLVLPPVASSGGGPTRTSVLGATPFGICCGIISTNPDAFFSMGFLPCEVSSWAQVLATVVVQSPPVATGAVTANLLYREVEP